MDGTVLIMDYSSYERQKVRHILERVGSFNIVDVGSINQFKLLDLVKIEPRLVILDLAFPTETDGFEALEKVRASGIGDVPIIVFTRSDNQELKSQALKYSVNDYIVKPYQVKRLESSIRSFIKIAAGFHYNTSRIGDIRMSFDDYATREIMFAKRTGNPLSVILITTLRLQPDTGGALFPEGGNLSEIYETIVKKAKKSLRSTDTIVVSDNRDIIILLPCTDEAGVRLVCEKISSCAAPEFEMINAEKKEYIYPVFVTFPKDGDSFQSLMEAAFRKVSNKLMLEKIVSIPPGRRKYADLTYNKYNRWF